jgi:cellulose synthase (UDP-forming)
MNEPLSRRTYDAMSDAGGAGSREARYPTPGRIFVMVFYVGVGLWYLYWRPGTFNHDALSFSLLLYGAEVFGFVTALLHLVMTWRITERVPPAPMAGLTVDVFIPTINESVDIVRRTAIAAMNISYPHQTWLLDDGARPEMKQLAESLGCRYLARTTNIDAKAGNLNHALAHSKAEFVAVFDADHAPRRDFLERTLGFFTDERVAFVQTPQDFFNLDSFQHRRTTPAAIWTEQSLFFKVIQQGKDFWNASFFCGSCGIIRRSSLDAIGGFATGTVTEDLHTSIRLHKRGFRSIYYAEPLAAGLAPDNAVPYLRQRVRWGQGAMQVWRKEGILTARGLTLGQRLCYLASVLTYFDGWQKLVFYFSPVVVLVTGVMPVAALDREFFLHFAPYYLLTFLVFEEVARGYGRTFLLAQYNLARFFAFIWATFGLFRRKLTFWVTDKGPANRSRVALYMAPQYAVLALNALAIPLGIAFHFSYGYLPGSGLAANIAWAAVNCILALLLLKFTLKRATDSRADYRFPVPLPALIKVPGRPACYATVDDVSSSGCRLHGKFPADLREDSELQGELHLPHGVLPFAAVVRGVVTGTSGGKFYVKALCCRFAEAAMPGARVELERFLYGSHLQWAINQLRDKATTPLSALRLRAAPTKVSETYWAPALIDTPSDDAPSQLALVSCRDFGMYGRSLLTFKPLPLDCAIIGLSFTRAGQTLISAKVVIDERFDTPTGPVYVYGIASLIREPQWIRQNISAIHETEALAPLAA